MQKGALPAIPNEFLRVSLGCLIAKLLKILEHVPYRVTSFVRPAWK